jgi:16S rRNA (guanine527-N7)-methyltransferase
MKTEKSSRLLTEGLTAFSQSWKTQAAVSTANFPLPGDISGLLERYMDEIELFNPAYGLVGVKTREELVVKHILDSLAPLGIMLRLLGDLPQAGDAGSFAPLRIADLGSGAGLPGLPLAIAFAGILPEARFTLIDRMGRRIGFLRNTLAVLGLSNVEVEEAEMEKAAPARFDMAVFRAFRPLDPVVLKAVFRLLKPSGFLAAYKGRREVIDAEMATAGAVWEVLPYTVPFLGEERHLVVSKGQ